MTFQLELEKILVKYKNATINPDPKKWAISPDSSYATNSAPSSLTQRKRGKPMAKKIEQLRYPFPLKSGELATLYVPLSITHSDVRRIVKMLAIMTEEAYEHI